MEFSRDELSIRKIQLERDIASKVSALVEEFKSYTGFPVTYVGITLEEVTYTGGYPEFIVTRAKVNVCI